MSKSDWGTQTNLCFLAHRCKARAVIYAPPRDTFALFLYFETPRLYKDKPGKPWELNNTNLVIAEINTNPNRSFSSLFVSPHSVANAQFHAPDPLEIQTEHSSYSKYLHRLMFAVVGWLLVTRRSIADTSSQSQRQVPGRSTSRGRSTFTPFWSI